MMLDFLETGKALYVLAAICGLGLAVRLVARNLYKRLIKETDNMTLTKNRYLRELKKEFQELKEEAQNSIDFRRKHITLNEWFEEWFQTYKLPVVKETSVYPMKNKYYGSFGKYLGERRLADITNIDI